MRRRQFLSALAAAGAAAPVSAWAQARLPVIGLMATGKVTSKANVDAFLQGMAGLGYVSGNNVVIEARYSEGDNALWPSLAAELVALSPRVIVSGTTTSHLALKNATATIPIVMASGPDAVGNKIVASLSNPGGNITGVQSPPSIIVSKQVELAHTLVGGVAPLGVVLNTSSVTHQTNLDEAMKAAAAVGRPCVPVDWERTRDALQQAFQTLVNSRVAIAVVPTDSAIAAESVGVIALAAAIRLPVVYGSLPLVVQGGLASYGVKTEPGFSRAAVFVDKILKGAKPADLPVEMMDPWMAININTAKALGLAVPVSVLTLADQVIE